MSKKIIIELNNDCLLQEYKVDRFDKNICLQLNDDCNCEIYGDNVVARRVDKKDIKTFAKAHKDLIGKNVNFVLYKSSIVKDILWGVGGASFNGKIYGVNGSLQIKIKNFKNFLKTFGGNVSRYDFRLGVLKEIKETFKETLKSYAKKCDGKIETMNEGIKELNELLIKSLQDDEEKLRSMGIDIVDLTSELIIENIKE